MKRKSKLLIFMALALLAIVALALTFTPYAQLAEGEAKAFLAQHGVIARSLTVDRLDLSGAHLKNIEIEKPVKVGVKEATVNFSDATFRLGDAYMEMSSGTRYVADMVGVYLLDLSGDTLEVEGDVSGTSHPFTARMTLKQAFGKTTVTALSVKDARLVWGGGTVRVPPLALALPLKKDVATTVQLHDVSLDTLLKKALNEKASAEGTVSGNLPLIIRPDGSFRFGSGLLTASDGGVIRIPPGTLPGESTQLAEVSTLLSDLRYSHLTIAIVPAANENFTVQLRLEGSNSAAYGGRVVKLNINLSGDVLDFVQSSLLPLANPAGFLPKDKP